MLDKRNLNRRVSTLVIEKRSPKPSQSGTAKNELPSWVLSAPAAQCRESSSLCLLPDALKASGGGIAVIHVWCSQVLIPSEDNISNSAFNVVFGDICLLAECEESVFMWMLVATSICMV